MSETLRKTETPYDRLKGLFDALPGGDNQSGVVTRGYVFTEGGVAMLSKSDNQQRIVVAVSSNPRSSSYFSLVFDVESEEGLVGLKLDRAKINIGDGDFLTGKVELTREGQKGRFIDAADTLAGWLLDSVREDRLLPCPISVTH